jgi:hypothetical protein
MSRAFPLRARSRFLRLVPVTLLVCAWSHPALAQHAIALESPALVSASLAALLASSRPFGVSIPPRVATVSPLGNSVQPVAMGRPAILPALYVSFAALQALDAHSTLAAVGAGRNEANPALKGIVDQPGAFLAVKVAATAGTLYLTERLWKKHRGAAVALMLVANGTYALIVANNYGADSRPRP